jgi:ribosomal protein L22
MPRAHGRATSIRKRGCHISLILAEIKESGKKEKKASRRLIRSSSRNWRLTPKRAPIRASKIAGLKGAKADKTSDKGFSLRCSEKSR